MKKFGFLQVVWKKANKEFDQFWLRHSCQLQLLLVVLHWFNIPFQFPRCVKIRCEFCNSRLWSTLEDWVVDFDWYICASPKDTYGRTKNSTQKRETQQTRECGTLPLSDHWLGERRCRWSPCFQYWQQQRCWLNSSSLLRSFGNVLVSLFYSIWL